MGDTEVLVRTRLALHAVAEQVLAAARYAGEGRIGLVVTDGGFGTPPFPGPFGMTRLGVAGTTLVAADDRGARTLPLTTIGELAAAVGVSPGAPAGVYPPATTVQPDDQLAVDARAARALADWFALGDAALRRFLDAEVPADAPRPEPTLWPEHFDLGVTLDEVNYGASPGDDSSDRPYLYVGPWEPHEGPFWNQPFGASRDDGVIGDVDTAVAFLREGRHLA